MTMDDKKMAGVVDEDGVLWSAQQPGEFTSVFGSCNTVWDSLVAAAEAHGAQPAAGERSIVSSQIIDGYEKLVLSKNYSWWSYRQYEQRAAGFGSGLVKTIPSLEKGDTVVIYAETSRAWMLAAYGCWRQGLVVGTIYATLGDDGASFGINQSKCKAVVADAKLLKVLAKIAGELSDLRYVITISDSAPPAESVAALKSAGITIYQMDELVTSGTAEPVAATPGDLDSSAVLMYTSGTTGNPKGVLLSNRAILSVIGASSSPNSAVSIGGRSTLRAGNTYLAYLPLAHIMELGVEVTCFANGCQVGYGSPGTIAGSSSRMLQTSPPQIGDAELLRPHLFVAAPAVLDKLVIAIKAKFAAASKTIQSFVAAGVASGVANYDRGGVGTRHLIAKLIFKKAQKLLGGRVELMVTGSAPLAAEAQKWVQTVFNCRVRQGYGLTESCAATCIALAADNSTCQVGPPQTSACVRLRDWEEGGYLNADKDGAVGMRRGEVLIGGPSLCSGYLVDPDDPDPDVVAKNRDEFVTINGIRYFCTGDIGQITPQGTLQIIDRKKDLVKLQQGEYVALSKVESALKASKYTAMPMVYADPAMSYCIALVCPNEPVLTKLAAELGVDGTLSELCADAKVIEAVLGDLQAACKAAKLQRFETPAKLVLIDEPWTPENDLLTAVQKLKRRQIAEHHKQQINVAYI